MLFNQRTPIIVGLLLAALSSCTNQRTSANGPQQRLTDYIAASFQAKETKDRQRMTDFLTAGAKNRLIAWSDDQFRAAFIEHKRQFVKLAIREVKERNEKESNVTYELTYLDLSKGAETRVTNKRMAEMVLENNQWFIREVHNIKELIEYKNEMSL